jgi:hypothetical protein
MPQSTSSTSFIFVSDTHIGNNFGICTPNPELGEGKKPYEASPSQLKLYNGFQKCCQKIKQPKKIGALFLGGDIVDGPNPKKPGQDIWTNDPVVAVYDFNQLMRPLASKANKVFLVRGSDYHVSPDRTVINYDELAAQMLGTDSYKTRLHEEKRLLSERVQALVKNGKKRTDINLEDERKKIREEKKNHTIIKKFEKEDNIFKKEVDSSKNNKEFPYPLSGVRFKGIFGRVAIVVKHQVSYSPNYMYRSTGLIRNDMLMTLQKERHFPDGYDSIMHAYGHVHYYHQSGNATHNNFTIPCWKANDTYLNQYGVTEPDFGIVEVIVEPNNEIIIHPYVLSGSDYPVEEPYRL